LALSYTGGEQKERRRYPVVLSVDPITGVGSVDVPPANGVQDTWVVSGWRVARAELLVLAEEPSDFQKQTTRINIHIDSDILAMLRR
jgi:hypothetical protein